MLEMMFSRNCQWLGNSEVVVELIFKKETEMSKTDYICPVNAQLP